MKAGGGSPDQREAIAIRLGEMFALSPMPIRGFIAAGSSRF